jgi:hypothetical protein
MTFQRGVDADNNLWLRQTGQRYWWMDRPPHTIRCECGNEQFILSREDRVYRQVLRVWPNPQRLGRPRQKIATGIKQRARDSRMRQTTTAITNVNASNPTNARTGR